MLADIEYGRIIVVNGGFFLESCISYRYSWSEIMSLEMLLLLFWHSFIDIDSGLADR